ncbi:MAG TPA: tyrosine-type recombinase/integrase [Gammaproteobacteria bacterium]|nr:tyrosine-type recombinase/integrase [Gammaproteobacteria bacterium]
MVGSGASRDYKSRRTGRGQGLKRHFKPLLKAAKLPDNLTLYCLRHSCATLLLQAGIHPKIVSERLGHASIVLTLDTYSHVLPTMQDEATTQIQRMLYG